MKNVLKPKQKPLARRRYAFHNRAFVVVPLVLLGITVLYLQFDWFQKNYKGRAPSGGVEQIHCEHCHGTGQVRDPQAESGFVMCPICQGLGYHNVRKLDRHDALCPACGGMGRVQDLQTGAFRICTRCDGRGLIRTVPAETNAVPAK